MTKIDFDLLKTVEYGGCSAKLSPTRLTELLSQIPMLKDHNVLVDIQSHDDAGVYRIDDERALVVTTDFFPPICSSAFDFGAIAAANSLSDIYAMGAKPLLALNLNMFPSNTIPLEVLRDILLGGQSKINESGAFTMGGHTIDDDIPKYGLAVVGLVHPGRVITNAGAKVGQKLILTKALGTGIIIAAQRLSLANEKSYNDAISQMKQLNSVAGELMQKYDIKGATDITGFGLFGHALKMAKASNVSIKLYADELPAIAQTKQLVEMGCISGAAFRNLDYCKESIRFSDNTSLFIKMLGCDAQTSGGLFMAVDGDRADELLNELLNSTVCNDAAIVGEVIPQQEYLLCI